MAPNEYSDIDIGSGGLSAKWRDGEAGFFERTLLNIFSRFLPW